MLASPCHTVPTSRTGLPATCVTRRTRSDVPTTGTHARSLGTVRKLTHPSPAPASTQANVNPGSGCSSSDPGFRRRWTEACATQHDRGRDRREASEVMARAIAPPSMWWPSIWKEVAVSATIPWGGVSTSVHLPGPEAGREGMCVPCLRRRKRREHVRPVALYVVRWMDRPGIQMCSCRWGPRYRALGGEAWASGSTSVYSKTGQHADAVPEVGTVPMRRKSHSDGRLCDYAQNDISVADHVDESDRSP